MVVMLDARMLQSYTPEVGWGAKLGAEVYDDPKKRHLHELHVKLDGKLIERFRTDAKDCRIISILEGEVRRFVEVLQQENSDVAYTIAHYSRE